MICRVRVSVFWLLVLAGCSTMPSEPPDDVTVGPSQSVVVVAPASVEVSNRVSAPALAPVRFAAPAPSVAVATNHFDLRESWVPLESWSEMNGFGAPHRVTEEAFPTYSFGSSNGTMAVKIGSQLAYWNGLEYRLGFAPLMIGGHPYVNSLDVRKNFAPLAMDPVRWKAGSVIVIDPGHGGTDVGAVSVFDGHFEKEYTLDCARRLEGLLTSHGWTVWLTRTNDVNVPLSSRVAFAEEHKADLFLSLHFNSAFPDRQQAGLETYCLTPAGMPSSLTRGYKDDRSLVYPNNRFDEENLQFAAELHRSVLKINGNADRGVRRARFLGVLQGQNRPAILVEGGYLSNPQEARQIADSAYRERYVEALAQALLGDMAPARTNLASQSFTVSPITNLDGKIN